MVRNLRVFWNICKDLNVFLLDFGVLIVKLKSWMKVEWNILIRILWIFKFILDGFIKLLVIVFVVFVFCFKFVNFVYCINLMDKELKFLL